jgi:hypothetical protein
VLYKAAFDAKLPKIAGTPDYGLPGAQRFAATGAVTRPGVSVWRFVGKIPA